MDKWKPLQPTSVHPPSAPDLTSNNAYAPPPKATRQAPPARPHPPNTHLTGTKRRSLLPSWGRGGGGSITSQYAQAPLESAAEDSTTDSAHRGHDIHFIGIFPRRVHEIIMRHMSLPDLAAYMTVCRTMAHVASQSSIWDPRAASMRWTSLPGISTTPFSPDPDRRGGNTTSSIEGVEGKISASVLDIPLPWGLPSYCALKSFKQALRPYRDSLSASADAPEGSMIFTGPAAAGTRWGPYEQSALLCNLTRSFRPAPRGPGLFEDLFDTALLSDRDEPRASFTSVLQTTASILRTQLLDLFRSADDRRSDALRAARHGATGTDGAVARAEGDLRLFATTIWQLDQDISSLDLASSSTLNDQDEITPSQSASSAPGDQRSSDNAQTIWSKNHGQQEISSSLPDIARPRENIVLTPTASGSHAALDFTPMDKFMVSLISHFRAEGELIASIFPPEQEVLLGLVKTTVAAIIQDYVMPLLSLAQTHSRHLYLRCCAASLNQSLRLAEAAVQVVPPKPLPMPTALAHDASTEHRIADVTEEWHRRFKETYSFAKCYSAVYEIWDSLLTEYMEDEYIWVESEMSNVAQRWEDEVDNESAASRADAAFLTAQNPAAVKRSVLTGFRDVLLLPVTVVPRTAVHVGGAVFRTAGRGVSQLNPLKWQTSTSASGTAVSTTPREEVTRTLPRDGGKGVSSSGSDAKLGYMDFSNGAPGLHGDVEAYSAEDEDEDGPKSPWGDQGLMEDDWSEEVRAWKQVATKASATANGTDLSVAPRNKRLTEVNGSRSPSVLSRTSTSDFSRPGTPSMAAAKQPTPVALQKMQLLLSLDTALQMIHFNRDSLKRLETLAHAPTSLQPRIQQVMDRIATAFLLCISDRHVVPGFHKAIQQIQNWKPADLDSDTANHEGPTQPLVEPLVHFFELVHVADTIAQLVQVYFDQELSRHVDRTDFLNGVVREKKKFEAALDEGVAAGLNAGVDLLMGQVEHIIATNQDPRDFYPEKPESMDLGKPTVACSKAVDCLQTHCRMLTGCADRNVLEVFWQEIALRLHSILCKHLKRQIVSLDGGFKVIADLNAYHAFVATLKQASLMPYFDALKMLGNVFIIENPKELAQLVRDSSLFLGTLTPDDVYEFLQARCDFKAIEKAIDKEMFGFKVSEDCTVM